MIKKGLAIFIILLAVVFLPTLLCRLGVFPFTSKAVNIPDDLIVLENARAVAVSEEPSGLRGLSFLTSDTTNEVHRAYSEQLSHEGWVVIDADTPFGNGDIKPTLALKKVLENNAFTEKGAELYISSRFVWIGLTEVEL
jgi:hypothetical protein